MLTECFEREGKNLGIRKILNKLCKDETLNLIQKKEYLLNFSSYIFNTKELKNVCVSYQPRYRFFIDINFYLFYFMKDPQSNTRTKIFKNLHYSYFKKIKVPFEFILNFSWRTSIYCLHPKTSWSLTFFENSQNKIKLLKLSRTQKQEVSSDRSNALLRGISA